MEKIYTHCLLAVMLGFCFQLKAQDKINDSVIINGKYTEDQIPDSIVIYVYLVPFMRGTIAPSIPHQRIVEKVNNSTFEFKVNNVTKPLYVSMTNANPLWRGSIMDLFIIEPGDNIVMKMGAYVVKPVFNGDSSGRTREGLRNTTFQGKGAAKYQYLHDLSVKENRRPVEIKQTDNQFTDLKIPLESTTRTYWKSDSFLRTLKEYNTKLSEQLSDLQDYKSKMSSNSYELLKLRLIALSKRRFYDVDLTQFFDLESEYKTITARDKGLLEVESARYKQLYRDSLSVLNPVDNNLILHSAEYLLLLIHKARTDAKYHHTTPYLTIKNGYKGKLRDYLLAFYFKNYISTIKDRDALLSDALKIVTDDTCRYLLNEVAHNSKGVLAYQFSLPDEAEKTVKLADFKGKVVFMDFWYTGCGACMKYYKDILKSLEEKYQENEDVIFITVSIDKLKSRWLSSLQSGDYTTYRGSKNMINLYTSGMGSNHDMIKHYSIQGYPRPLLIGKDGKIFCSDGSFLRNAKGLEEQINLALGQ